MTQILKLSHRTDRTVLDSKTIPKFKVLANRRDIRRTTVNRIFRMLDAGKHFESELIVSRRDKELRILDGNHRFEAVKKYLKHNPDAGVEVEISLFEELDDEAERKLYSQHNSAAKQSTADVLKQYWDVLNIQKQMNSTDFPVKVSHKTSINHIALNKLLWPYLTRNSEVYTGDSRINAFALIDVIREWNGRGNTLTGEGQKTYSHLKDFTTCYTDAFGEFSKQNYFWNSAIFSPLFRVWWENRDDFTNKEMTKRFKRLTTEKGSVVVESWKSMGASTSVCVTAIKEFLDVMNTGFNRKKLFIYGLDKRGDRARIYGR